LITKPIRHVIRKIGIKPEPLAEASLGKGARLEQRIVDDPAIALLRMTSQQFTFRAIL
jgi:hypothetical protein